MSGSGEIENAVRVPSLRSRRSEMDGSMPWLWRMEHAGGRDAKQADCVADT